MSKQVKKNSKSQQSSQESTSLMVCKSHPSQGFTHICLVTIYFQLLKQCLEPLCSECVTLHIKLHQNQRTMSKIENIMEVRSDCQRQLIMEKQKIQSESETIKIEFNQNEYFDKCMLSINKLYKQIVQLIDGYFEQLTLQLQQQIKNLDSLKIESEKVYNSFQKQVNYCDDLLNQLAGINFVKGILFFFTREMPSNQQEIFQDIQKQFEYQAPKIGSDSRALGFIEEQLKSFCNIRKSQPLKSIPKMDFSMPIIKQSIYDKIPPKSEYQTSEFKIFDKNHFNQNDYSNKVLTFFEEDTKRAFELPIFDSEHMEIKQVQLNMSVPLNHRSITTSSGEHLLVGGISRERNRYRASNQVYSYKNDELLEHSETNFGRAMHGLCQLDKYIFAISGTQTNDENASMRKCEKMEIKTKVWTPIADCLVASSGCVAIPFNDKYIFKIGGKVNIFTPCNVIEVYDIYKNAWVKFFTYNLKFELKFKFSNTEGFLRLPFNANGVQVALNQILIFGGSVHDVKSNEATILQITENLQENSEGLILLSKPIPRPIEFKTTTAIIEFEMIWVFSDVKNKPRVLKGDESGWVEI